MFLADSDILKQIKEGRIGIDPFVESQVQAAAYDLRLHTNFRVFRNDVTHVDVKEKEEVTRLIKVEENGPFVIHPGQFVLASTMEHIRLPNDLVGVLEGRSSLGRLGLIVHATASFIAPGADMNITFEMTNISNLPIRLYAGMRVAQLAFATMSAPVSTGYGTKGKYQNQEPPTPSLIWKDFE